MANLTSIPSQHYDYPRITGYSLVWELISAIEQRVRMNRQPAKVAMLGSVIAVLWLALRIYNLCPYIQFKSCLPTQCLFCCFRLCSDELIAGFLPMSTISFSFIICNMRAFNSARLLASLIGLLLLTRYTIASAITSGIFEVDVLFPRNDTYAPQSLMPVVFALQKPGLSIQLESSIHWQLWLGGNSADPTFIYNNAFEPSLPYLTPNFSTTTVEPVYLANAVNTSAYPDGPWTFQWAIYVVNCSAPTTFVMRTGTVTFTTSKDAKAPDLVAATAPDLCRNATAYTFDVHSFNNGSVSAGNSCGFLGSFGASAPNPCAVSIDAAAASGILANASANACSQGQAAACARPSGEGVPSESAFTATASGLSIALVAAAAALISIQ